MTIQEKFVGLETLLSAHRVALPSLFKLNLEYAALRVAYHIDLFEAKVKEVHSQIIQPSIFSEIKPSKVILRVSPSIFYEFDAVLYSSGAFMSDALRQDANNEIPADIRKNHRKQISLIRKEYELHVIPIRNDVVHLNPSGVSSPISGLNSRSTTYGYLAYYDANTNSLELQSIRQHDGQIVNLISLVDFIKKLVVEYVDICLSMIITAGFTNDARLKTKKSIAINGRTYNLSLEDFLK